MTILFCECTSCKYNKDRECRRAVVTVSDGEMTSAGFLPLCVNYEEEGEEE